MQQFRRSARRIWHDAMARSAAGAVGVTIIGAALGYSTQLGLARLLGPEGYGTYTYSTAWLNVAQLLAALDLGSAALRFGGAYLAAGSWGLLRGFIRRSRVIVGTSALIVAGAGALGVWVCRDLLPPGRSAGLLAVCMAVLPATLLALESNILQALHRTFGARVPTAVVRPLVLLAAVAAAAGAGRRLGAFGTLAANAAALWVAALLSIWWTERVRPAESRHEPAATESDRWLRMSLATLLGSVLQMVLSQQSDVIVAGSLLGTREAGLYSAAGQLASLVTFGVGTINTLAAPHFAAFERDPRSPAFVGVVRRVSALNWALSVPVAGVLALAGPWILRSFGEGYAGAYPTLCVLLISQVVSAAGGGLAGTMLTMVNHHRTATIVIGLSAALNLALTAGLTPRYGIVGTAWATTIATVVRAAVMQVIIHRSFGLWLVPGLTHRALRQPEPAA